MHMKSGRARIAGLGVAALTLTSICFMVMLRNEGNTSHHAAAARPAIATAGRAAASPELLKQVWTNTYGKLPMAFERNQGQTNPEVRYLSHGNGYELFLTNQEAVLTLQTPRSDRAQATTHAVLSAGRPKSRDFGKSSVLRMRFNGANPATDIVGTNLLPGKVSYFVGNDPKKWYTDIPSYEVVRYKAVYPGVDLLFYGQQHCLEYDFVVEPGADPNNIALSFEGARKLQISSHGDLVMGVSSGRLALRRPVIYQEINGERREITGGYSIADDHQIRFWIAGYDHTRPLTIDPVLNYSTYVGGENFDLALGIALDAEGDAFIAGSTTSTTFPQMNPESGAVPSDIALGTVFVSELNPTGTALLYSTYLGGTGNGTFGDSANAIAVDASSPANIYVTGFTGSSDFPVSTILLPYQGTAPTGVTAAASAFVTKLTPSASGSAQLAYSSYLGGDTFDEGFGVAVDVSGNALIAGETKSTNFPQKGTQITAGLSSAAGNAFLTEINTTVGGSGSLVYSTYLGGTSPGSSFFGFADVATAVAIDGNSNAYVVGGTSSTDFPTAGTAIPGSAACGANTRGSAFISVINTSSATLGYSHCLTGNDVEIAFGVALGTGVPAVATKVAYITGETGSSNFPVSTNSIPPPASVANRVAFVALVNTNSASPLQYSTFLGGKNSDVGLSIGSDAQGNAYVAGATDSNDFPITQGALVEALNNPSGMAFVSKIAPIGNGISDLVYSTYFGGQASNSLTSPDTGQGIAVSGTNAYITGEMASPDMPVSTGAYQASLRTVGATANAYVADLPLIPTISVSPTSINFGTQLVGTPTAAQYITLTNNTSASVGLTLPPTFVPITPAVFAELGGTCTTTLAGGASCTVGVTFTPSASATYAATLKIVDALDGPSHPIQVALTGTGSTTIAAIAFSPTSLTFAGQLLTTTSTAQTVTITNPSTANALNISAIAFSNNDFGIASSSTCGLTFPITIAVSPGGTPCAVSVVFKPAATTTPGSEAGTMIITDNANGSPQSVPLTGTAWDFSVSAPGSVTVAKGAMGTFPVTITGLGGFTGTVSFTCTPGSTLVTACAVPTTNAAAAPGATATATLTSSSFVVVPDSKKVPPAASLEQVLLVMLTIAMLFTIPSTRRFRSRMGMTGAILVVLVVAGCTGNHMNTKTTTVTITPSSGGVTKPAITVNVNIT